MGVEKNMDRALVKSGHFLKLTGVKFRNDKC